MLRALALVLVAAVVGDWSVGSTSSAQQVPTAVGGGPASGGGVVPREVERPTVVGPGRTEEGTYSLTLASGPFPGTPWENALVYVPAGIDRARPLSVVVFIHGWNGCARVVSASAFGACRRGGHRRVSLSLIEQMRASRAAAVLVVPQMAMDRRSSDSGTLGEEGGFRRFLAEVLEKVSPQVGTHGVDALERVVLASHSGGYITVRAILDRGGVPVDEVALFDSLYQYHWDFARWITDHAERFDRDAPRPMRFVSLHRGGGTGAETTALQRMLRARFAGRSGAVFVRRRAAPLTADEARAPVVLARVPGDHAQTVRWNFREVLEGSYLPRVGE